MFQLNHISKTYQTTDETVWGLKDITLTFPNRGLVSIVGPSGCGKTTLLNIIGGLDRQTNGDFFIDGRNTQSFNDTDWNLYRNQHIGFVFQHYYLMPHLTVYQNIELPLLIGQSYDDHTRDQMIKEALQTVGLEDKARKFPNQLSGGQQQKIAIARALVKKPTCLIADEPTGSLDPKASQDVLSLLKKISENQLVIIVTHQRDLAESFSDQMIFLEHGLVSKVDVIKKEKVLNTPETSLSGRFKGLSFVTLFSLVMANLSARKLKTLLIAFIASIGMIGIALVIAVASGFNQHIETQKQETLNSLPIRVESFSLVVPLVNERYQPNMPTLPNTSVAYPRNIQYEFQTFNRITEPYYTHVKAMDPSIYQHIHYNFNIRPSLFYQSGDNYLDLRDDIFGDSVKALDMSLDYINEHYDVLTGRMITETPYELIVVLDKFNRLDKKIVMELGFTGDDPLDFETLMDIELRYIPNDIYYTHNGFTYDINPIADVYHNDQAIPMRVVGIIRLNNDDMFDIIQPGVYYHESTTNAILDLSLSSEIVVSQLESSTHVMTSQTLSSNQKDTALRAFGYATYPLSYTIIPNSFDDKDAIMSYLLSYNDTVDSLGAIEPLDLAGIALATIRQSVDATTFILLVFAVISLIVSNVMIAMVTYTQVLRRMREIGVLRSMGTRKLDVGLLFYIETLMIGLISGVIAIIISYALLPVINLLIKSATTIEHIARLTLPMVLVILFINLVFTGIAAFIPAMIAAKKDPAECLRTES
ncbi:MAG: ATP-binding cassette domain-containing protein [Acholeplasmataceae bacterium]